MKKHIAEELPARKFKPSAGAPSPEKNTSGGVGGGKDDKGGGDKVRQAVYDIRYRARREEVPLQTAFSQYMANSSMSQEERTAVRAKLFGESFEIEDFASTSVAKALFEVFASNKEENISENELLNYFREEQILNSKGERKYKVEVVGKDGRSYVRYATREKINDLRLNPNIKSVEMTDKGVPYEGEKTQGKLTAAVKSGKDWDGDGKVESGSKEHAGVVHNAIQRKRGGVPDGQDTRKESVEYINEIMDSEDERNEVSNVKGKGGNIKKKPIDVLKKDKKNNVSVCPTEDIMNHYTPYGTIVTESDLTAGQLKFYRMIQEKAEEGEAVSQNQQQLAAMAIRYLEGEMPNASEEVKKMAKMGKTKLLKFARTKHKGLPEKVEEAKCETSDKSTNKSNKIYNDPKDPRDDKTAGNLIKNILRSGLGVKNPIIISASNEMEGEQIDEVLGGQSGDGYIGHPRLGIKNPLNPPKPGAAKTAPKNKGLAARLGDRANKIDEIEKLTQSYEPEGEVIDELRRSEKEGKGSPDTSGEFISRAQRKERGPKGAVFQYSGSKEFGSNVNERGKKKNEPGSQHQRLNPPEKKGRKPKRGPEDARQEWHSARD